MIKTIENRLVPKYPKTRQCVLFDRWKLASLRRRSRSPPIRHPPDTGSHCQKPAATAKLRPQNLHTSRSSSTLKRDDDDDDAKTLTTTNLPQQNRNQRHPPPRTTPQPPTTTPSQSNAQPPAHITTMSAFVPVNPRPFLLDLVNKDVIVRLKWNEAEYKGRLVVLPPIPSPSSSSGPNMIRC